jgi:SAM-dependent methyltransferase
MSDGQAEPDPEKIRWFPEQSVVLEDFPAEGYILDVGGGGEGIIGLLKGRQVVSIDPSLRELEEAAGGPLKIVMDARDLRFPDRSFENACAFFTFMFIDPAEHGRVLAEVFRVLKPGGVLRLWDFALPSRGQAEEEVAAFRLTVRLPERTVETGYGTRWGNVELSLKHYTEASIRAGFEVLSSEQSGETFVLILKKPE